MKPQIQLATALTPDGGEMELYQHDCDFLIKINGQNLMNSRQHESELELARLGCSHLYDFEAPRILIGGLGMGYTLRHVLDMFGRDANVIVSELLIDVVDWNREILGELNGQPLDDKRTDLIIGDFFQLILSSTDRFDAILLDIDNGPCATTDSANQHLYTPAGIQACRRALSNNGCLAVWSSEPSKAFERLLMNCGFHVRRYKVPAYAGAQKKTHFVWVAAEDETILPPGGGEPHLPQKYKAKRSRMYNSRRE